MSKPFIYADRIPYDARIDSQLSVAKYYWWIQVNGENYVLDYDNCNTEERDWETYYFPDLVKETVLKEQKRNNPSIDISPTQ